VGEPGEELVVGVVVVLLAVEDGTEVVVCPLSRRLATE
jgi:hypothetical protein